MSVLGQLHAEAPINTKGLFLQYFQKFHAKDGE
jgi:hypothetical protein